MESNLFFKKRAVGEIFSWLGATVLIVFIMALSIVLYFSMHPFSGSKLNSLSGAHFLDGIENQRATSYFLNYGLDGNEKGKILYLAYEENNEGIKKLFDQYEKEKGASGKGALFVSFNPGFYDPSFPIDGKRRDYAECDSKTPLIIGRNNYFYVHSLSPYTNIIEFPVSFLPTKEKDLMTYPLWVVAWGSCNER